MDNYKPNSHKVKDDQLDADLNEKKVEKVIAGSAKPKKRNTFADVFISEDVNNVKTYILMEVLVPAIKKAISDIVTSGIDMILYGDSGHTKRNSTSSKISYQKFSDKSHDRKNYYTGSRTGYSYDDIILDNRGEADEVLSRMDELISTYGLVSVADLYDLVGVTCNYTDNKYGWTDIRNANIVRVRDGYLLKLPKALPLN